MDAGVAMSNFRELLKRTDRIVDGGGIDPACQIGGQKGKHVVSAVNMDGLKGGPAKGHISLSPLLDFNFFRMILEHGKVMNRGHKKDVKKN
jgi:hypothetical protein